jgi:hypothetical protein
MRHWPIEKFPSDHYGVSINTSHDGILVQLQVEREQVRAILGISEAKHMIVLLTETLNQLRGEPMGMLTYHQDP